MNSDIVRDSVYFGILYNSLRIISEYLAVSEMTASQLPEGKLVQQMFIAIYSERDWAAAPRKTSRSVAAHLGLTAVIILTQDEPTRRQPLFVADHSL